MVTVQLRTYLSIQHLRSARILIDQARNLESDRPPLSGYEPSNELDVPDEHAALVTASVLSSYSALEASINESWADAHDYPQRLDPLSEPAKARLTGAWSSCRRKPTLLKYELFAVVVDADPGAKGEDPWQSIETLRSLRNRIVHFQPGWTEAEARDRTPGMLRDRFSLSPFARDTSPFFPQQCLSASFANWALCSVVSFLDDFHHRVGVKPVYAHVREQVLRAQLHGHLGED